MFWMTKWNKSFFFLMLSSILRFWTIDREIKNSRTRLKISKFHTYRQVIKNGSKRFVWSVKAGPWISGYNYGLSVGVNRSFTVKPLPVALVTNSCMKWGASSRWSFRPIFAWGSIETATIAMTHPTLESVKHFIQFLLPRLYILNHGFKFLHWEFSNLTVVSQFNSRIWKY